MEDCYVSVLLKDLIKSPLCITCSTILEEEKLQQEERLRMEMRRQVTVSWDSGGSDEAPPKVRLWWSSASLASLWLFCPSVSVSVFVVANELTKSKLFSFCLQPSRPGYPSPRSSEGFFSSPQLNHFPVQQTHTCRIHTNAHSSHSEKTVLLCSVWSAWLEQCFPLTSRGFQWQQQQQQQCREEDVWI